MSTNLSGHAPQPDIRPYFSIAEFGMNDYGVEIRKTPVKNPSCNIYAERWVWSAKHECLNYFTVLGKHHLEYIVEEYVDYYNSPPRKKGF